MTTTPVSRAWTIKATSNLFDLTREGLTQAQIAKRLRRTPKAIERKVAKVRRSLATELRRKSYLTMDFASIVKTIKATDTLRIGALIAGGRI